MNIKQITQNSKELKVSILCIKKGSKTANLYVRSSLADLKPKILTPKKEETHLRELFTGLSKPNTGHHLLYARKKFSPSQTTKLKSSLQVLYSQLVKDEDSFNRFFEGLETDLDFIGVVEFDQEIKNGAKNFVKNCKFSSIKTHILSGDQKSKCIDVGFSTGVIDVGQGFCDLDFEEEKVGVSQIKGLFEEIKEWNKWSAKHKGLAAEEMGGLFKNEGSGSPIGKGRRGLSSMEVFGNLSPEDDFEGESEGGDAG
jgi:hypothetical protein